VSDRWWAVALRFLAGFIISTAVMTAATGCAASQKVVDTAAKTARAGVYLAHITEPFLLAAYEAEQRACLPLPTEPGGAEVATCVADVRARWMPVKTAFEDLRLAWCELDKLFDGTSCPEATP
jgi:hypothetical protein